MVLKTKTWIFIIGLLLILSLSFLIYGIYFQETGTIVNIYQDGKWIRSIDLSKVTETETFVLTGENGSNTIEIGPGKICILEADCPDQVCVQSGWLIDSAAPIVCLPHKLVIALETVDSREENPDIVLDGIVK